MTEPAPERTRPAARRPRLQDVARAAGVSVVTVSRAFSGSPVVTEATRRRIEKAAASIDYVPDLVARSMARQRSGIVAAFVPTLLDPIFGDMIEGLSDVLRANGLHLLLGNTEYDPVEEEGLVAATLGRRPDGLVLTGSNHTARLRRIVKRAAIPAIEAWALASEPIDCNVGFSHFEAGRALVRHVVERGYRRIGFVGRPRRDNDRAGAKQNGYLQALAEAGLSPPPGAILEIESRLSAGRVAVDALVATRKVDAIMFSGDDTAAGAFLTCRDRGLSVPGDVALCGFGDYEIARMLPGGMTTVRVNGYAIGQRSGELLISLMAGEAPRNSRIDTGFEVVVRGST